MTTEHLDRDGLGVDGHPGRRSQPVEDRESSIAGVARHREAGDSLPVPDGSASRDADQPPGRASLSGITPYDTDRAPVPLDVSHNTNLWGAPPGAVAAVRAATGSLLAEYPGLESARVREAIAAYASVPAGTVVTGCGSDDLLEATFLGLADPGDAVAYPEPTFSMIPVFARMTGLVPVPVPLADDRDIDPDALLATGARIIYIAAPNNPTGIPVAPERLERVIAGAPGYVLIDEAYAEFCDGRWIERAAHDERLVVVRTMSKAWGMAGLRFGYGAAVPALRRAIEKARGPYTVNAVAEHAALAALEHDVVWMREAAARAVESRERLRAELLALGLEPLPSATNFLYVPLDGAARVARRMEVEHGVRVRAFRPVGTLGEALRIGVGPWPFMERLLDALRASLTLGADR